MPFCLIFILILCESSLIESSCSLKRESRLYAFSPIFSCFFQGVVLVERSTESCYALWQRKRFFPLLNAGLSFGPNPLEISLKAQKVNTYSQSSAELASDVKDRECCMCGN